MICLVSPQMPVRALLKARPLAVDLLEKRHVRFWDALDRPLGELARHEILSDLLDEIAQAPVPAADSDWLALPINHLADYLTEGHRAFLLEDLRDMAHILDIHTLADSEESEGLRAIHKAFHDFSKALHEHISEEEDILFPKVLRYEACLRDNRVHPEFHSGSIQSYMAVRLTQEEKQLAQAGDHLTDRIQQHAETHGDSSVAAGLHALLGAMRERLEDHGNLEARVLFPTAREMEKTLYNLGINGDPTVVLRRRGPKDSDTLRPVDL